MLNRCVKPWATRWALYFLMVLLALCLMRNTHLQLTMFLSVGWGTLIQVPASSNILISRSMASCHFGQLDWDRASVRVFRLLPVLLAVAFISSSLLAISAKSVSEALAVYVHEVL